jgi:very-short-patch-repair endonuclease
MNNNPIYEVLARAAKERNLVYNGHHVPYNPRLVPHAEELRCSMTECEKRVWKYVQGLQSKCYAQRVIDHYIVDFYIPAARLVIEIDGEQHATSEGKEYDSTRDEIMTLYGLEVLRFPNQDVRYDFSMVCVRIDETLVRRERAIKEDNDEYLRSPDQS